MGGYSSGFPKTISFIPVPAPGVGTPTIANIVAVLANTEYSYALPLNTTRYSVMARGMGRLQVAFAPGDTSTNFITVTPGAKLREECASTISIILHFQSTKAGEVIEILSWT
jgi:hypothetical protein